YFRTMLNILSISLGDIFKSFNAACIPSEDILPATYDPTTGTATLAISRAYFFPVLIASLFAFIDSFLNSSLALSLFAFLFNSESLISDLLLYSCLSFRVPTLLVLLDNLLISFSFRSLSVSLR